MRLMQVSVLPLQTGIYTYIKQNSAITGYGLTGGTELTVLGFSGINILSPNNGYGRIYF